MTTSALADQLLEELSTTPNYREDRGPSMRSIAKVSYTHDAFIDLVISTPTISQRELAAHFGYTEAWVSQIFCSDAFQERLAARKNEIVDPTLRLSTEERIKALLRRSLEVLEEKLHKPSAQVSDQLAIRAAEFGARSLGLGRQEAPREAPREDRLVILAGRLVSLQRDVRSGHAEIIEGEGSRLPNLLNAASTEEVRVSGSGEDKSE